MSPEEIADITTVLRERHRTTRARIVAATVLGALFGAFVGWGLMAAWWAAFVLLQTYEKHAYPLSRSLTPRSARGLLWLTALNAVVFASIALVGPLVDGPWGATGGAWMLAGATCYVVLSNIASRQMFRAALAPFALMMVLLLIESRWVGAPWSSIFTMGAAGLMVLGVAGALWRAAAAARARETAARDESERRRLEAESAVAAKSAFIAVVSHELRTPISAILAGAEDLRRNAHGSEAAKAEMIAEAGAMMRTLLNDLLDQAKLEAGRMSVETIPFDLRHLLAQQLIFWRAEARRKGLRLRLEGGRSSPQWVSGDPTRLRQILNNLLSNAIKFTEAGGVTLSLGADGEGRVVLSVQDTGRGLDAAALEQLFTPFQQAAPDVARTHGGTGLGLAISRDLARLMNGDLVAESRPGHGACFTLALPLPEASTPASPLQAAEQPDLPPAAVLVVDDHEINRRAIGLMLRELDVSLTEAASGFEALGLLEQQPFDLVLMDCHMPGMDGLSVTRELRRRAGPNQQTPVIAVTGAGEPAHIAACHDAGMNDHVLKPIDAARLIEAMGRALSPAGNDSLEEPAARQG
ncbi:ATP-binding protein [Phenylobacterium sp.]|uniref:ATP-binding protein n=1 Tax=Phenylobacterium sp. TaxID=1871053 RepID=UPI00272F7612|nr:ATP-binding protein [Phenylobacterium sp.]MDP1875057.1 response regulator [Phenylobacterium sp.]